MVMPGTELIDPGRNHGVPSMETVFFRVSPTRKIWTMSRSTTSGLRVESARMSRSGMSSATRSSSAWRALIERHHAVHRARDRSRRSTGRRPRASEIAESLARLELVDGASMHFAEHRGRLPHGRHEDDVAALEARVLGLAPGEDVAVEVDLAPGSLWRMMRIARMEPPPSGPPAL
jgi:hypothetical protein